MWKSIFDEIASVVTGRRIIKFETTASVPYEIVVYLESVGVVVWPGQASMQPDGNARCNIHVRDSQFAYAAGLLAGMRERGVLLIEPQGVKPIAPRTSWGKPTKSRGVFAGIMRGVAETMGASAKVPPVKGRGK
jgi:hypothetical protein